MERCTSGGVMMLRPHRVRGGASSARASAPCSAAATLPATQFLAATSRPRRDVALNSIGLGLQRHDDVQTLAACRSAKRLKLEALQPLPHLVCGLDDLRPGYAITGVEIEHQPVGMRRVGLVGTPWMKLDG